tara:strand:- start:1371 stop:1580 length:210 start_codon:yes stop_codon:yes gene_type:complete
MNKAEKLSFGIGGVIVGLMLLYHYFFNVVPKFSQFDLFGDIFSIVWFIGGVIGLILGIIEIIQAKRMKE